MYNEEDNGEERKREMLYLVLAILSSAMVSIFMRLSSDRVSGNISMLAVNYLTCLAISLMYTGTNSVIPEHPAFLQTFGMGAVHGFLYLFGFVMLQMSVKQHGVVLSSIFMKLGLLVPMLMSVLIFGERPAVTQIIGFVIAIAAIVLINVEGNSVSVKFRFGLLLLLLGGGCADAMSKVFEEVGHPEMESQFLLYTFLAAWLLCVALMLQKKQRPGCPEFLFGCAVGIPNFFSAKFLLKALESVPAVIAYPTYSVATILVVTLVGVLAFRERLEKRQWIAVGAILMALIMLNM